MSTTSVQRSDDVVEVVLGVDTHLDVHVVVALDQSGRPLGELAAAGDNPERLRRAKLLLPASAVCRP